MDTPVLCWNILLLQSEGQESPEQKELRILLCSIHTPSTPGYAAILFSISTYFSVLWRSFLVLHAQGFIRNGQLNLHLFSQLYWLIAISFFCLGLIPNQVLHLKGTFPKDSVRGLICLLIRLNDETREKGDGKVVSGLFFTFGLNTLLFVFYLSSRSRRLIKGMSPRSKMSSIGLYKRNFLDYQETLALSIAWSILAMLYGVIIELYKYFKLSPEHAFFIDTFCFIFVFEVFTLSIVFTLSYRDIPVFTKPPKIRQFYVHLPANLVPRRPLPVLPLPYPPVVPLPYPQSPLPHPSFLLTPASPVKVKGKGEGIGNNRRCSPPINRTKLHTHMTALGGQREEALTATMDNSSLVQFTRCSLKDVQ